MLSRCQKVGKACGRVNNVRLDPSERIVDFIERVFGKYRLTVLLMTIAIFDFKIFLLPSNPKTVMFKLVPDFRKLVDDNL